GRLPLLKTPSHAPKQGTVNTKCWALPQSANPKTCSLRNLGKRDNRTGSKAAFSSAVTRGSAYAAIPCGRLRAHRRRPRPSHRLDAHECEQHHAQQYESVTEAGNLGLAVGAAGVADRNLDRLEAELGGAEDQIEIAERIEIAEIAATGLEARIVGAGQRLGAAQRIGEPLREQPGEQQREALVGDEVEKTHGLVFHRIDQARAVDELALAGANRIPE